MVGMLDPSMFGGADYGDTAPYPDTSMMGMLTGTPLSPERVPTPRPRPRIKTVSLEGGIGAGAPSPPPDEGPISGRSPAVSAAPEGPDSGSGRTASDQDQSLAGRGKPKGFGDILNNIGDLINSRSNTLLALGAGFAGAQSPALGASRAFQLAGPALQTDISQGKQNQTVQALIAKGMPPEMAQLAVNNPDVLKQILPRMFGAGKQYQHVTVTDELGNQHVMAFDPDTGQFKKVEGDAGGGGSGLDMEKAVAATQEYLESGKLPNDPILADLVSATNAYMTGGTMPTGNPRARTIASQAKLIAQRVAAARGEPNLADDALYPERRKMAVDLSASSNNSMGGILTNGSSAFHHLGELSDAFVNQGQYGSSSGVPGSQVAAAALNWLGNVPGATTDAAGKMQAVRDTAGHYGQESTKFYAGSGGGEGERTRALNETASPGTTATQQAAFLEQEKNLMLARLGEKVNQLEGTLGKGTLDRKIPKYREGLQKEIEKIDANIAKLRAGTTGGAPVSAPAAPAPKPLIIKPGMTITVDKFGNQLP